MPFDPNLPAANSPNTSAEMRAQFNGLKDLIDALTSITAAQVDAVTTLNPGDAATVSLSIVGSTLHCSFGIPRGNDGQAGMAGPPGPPFAAATVDSVITLNPGDPAAVNVSFDGTYVRFQFAIPRGYNGSDGGTGAVGPPGPPFAGVVVDGVLNLNPGDLPTVVATFDGTNVHFLFGLPRGYDGNDGGPGPVGPTGPPFTSFVVDGVNTLNPGDNATVQTNFDGSNVRFTFGVPRGFTGNDGGMGSQGPPGEVSNAQLSTAVSGTSNNTNAVATLDTPFADPDAETLRQKMNELVLALRR